MVHLQTVDCSTINFKLKWCGLSLKHIKGNSNKSSEIECLKGKVKVWRIQPKPLGWPWKECPGRPDSKVHKAKAKQQRYNSIHVQLRSVKTPTKTSNHHYRDARVLKTYGPCVKYYYKCCKIHYFYHWKYISSFKIISLVGIFNQLEFHKLKARPKIHF